ncbi:hypothetical protein [Streptomyces sp. NPDC048650]|uniref:hypothetical protein n=1 Tax=unclassified Streptomyces TaxID=2593676 RepID=UPI00372426A6
MPDTDPAHSDPARDELDHGDSADPGYCADHGDSADPGYCAAPGAAFGGPAGGPPYADCVQCGRPTEYPAARPGIVLCPVCEWQEAQRSACSG